MQPQLDRYLQVVRARFAKGGVVARGSDKRGRGLGGIDFPAANEGSDWNFGSGNSGFWFGPHGGQSLYPTYYTNQGNLGWLPHGQQPGSGYGFGGSGAGFTTGGFNPLSGAGIGTPGMGGSLGPGAFNSSGDTPLQLHSLNRGGVVQEQDDRTPAWFIEKIGGETLTPEELNRKWMDWQWANEQARKRAMNEQYSRGGTVRPTAKPLQGYGRDTVPAALTPGEAVFNRKQLGAIQPRPGQASRLRPDQIMAMMKAARK